MVFVTSLAKPIVTHTEKKIFIFQGSQIKAHSLNLFSISSDLFVNNTDFLNSFLFDFKNDKNTHRLTDACISPLTL